MFPWGICWIKWRFLMLTIIFIIYWEPKTFVPWYLLLSVLSSLLSHGRILLVPVSPDTRGWSRCRLHHWWEFFPSGAVFPSATSHQESLPVWVDHFSEIRVDQRAQVLGYLFSDARWAQVGSLHHAEVWRSWGAGGTPVTFLCFSSEDLALCHTLKSPGEP